MAYDTNSLLRVAVSGAHSTGKTTLAEDLCSALNARGVRTAIAPEPIRLLEGEPVGSSPEERFTRLLQIHFERLGQPGFRCCIYDRSLLDFCVYMAVEQVDAAPVLDLANALLPWYLPWIGLHLYLPPDIELTPDDRRPTSPGFRDRIDRELRATAARHAIELKLLHGTREERVAEALGLVSALLDSPR